MKTASRIVGTTAFRQGFHAQDSPVYGAERRGAPLVAFTRFGPEPVLERGVILYPDIVVIADASLLDDPMVKPLQGLSADGIVLVNSTQPAAAAAGRVAVYDFTALALEFARSTAALSVALGAAAAKLAGLELQFLEQAVEEELQDLKLAPERRARNLDLARACYAHVDTPPVSQAASAPPPRSPVRVVTPEYHGAWAGTASVVSAPNTSIRKTGDWRVMRPIVDFSRCTHCWICYAHCPDGVISLDAVDAPQIDYSVCKGCLICAEECPIDAIESVREGVV